MEYKIQILVLILTAYWCEAYKILAVFPLPSKSHSILGDAHVRHLLEAGHEVTYITPFSMPDHPRLRQIHVGTDNYPAELSMKKIFNKEVDFNDPNAVMQVLMKVSAHTLKNEEVQILVNDPKEQFDVVIAQWLFTQLYCGFAAVFNCPYIWSSSLDTHPLILSLIDEPSNPAFTTGVLSKNNAPFTFVQRIQELWNLIRCLTFMNTYVSYFESAEYEKWLGPSIIKRGRSIPSFEEVKYNASLIIGNANALLGQPIKLPQSYKAVGGFHVDLEVKPLPEDLKTYLDKSKNGLIYFSLGSNMKSKDLPDAIRNSLLEMFGKLKQNVLWKYEEPLNNIPDNVKIITWAPQQGILAHPNCVLFITHGGLLSTTEALHFARPIIGIPILADQYVNLDRAVLKGYAKKLSLGFNLADDLRVAIEEVVSDPRYAIKAKEDSLVYHDRILPPAAELVHWVEHVVRTRGAPHLRSPALMVPWYQKMYLDLLALVIFVLYLIKRSLNHVVGRFSRTKHLKTS